MTLLKFGHGKNNGKIAKLEKALGKRAYTFSLPAGYTCPGAKDCMARFDRKSLSTVDGKDAKFRCFAASLEGMYPTVRSSTDTNLALLKACKTPADMAHLIESSLPLNAEIVRIHVGGDFFSAAYFEAWCIVAKARPSVLFYAYTKSIHAWLKVRDMIPLNLRITGSLGGKWDSELLASGLKTSHVVFSVQEASILGLTIDNDDTSAAIGSVSFALLIHGMQAKGSSAGVAVRALKGKVS